MRERSQQCTPIEQMIVSGARLIEDGTVLMVGTQWPVIVTLLAKRLHAPNVTLCYEGGIVLGRIPDRIPLFSADPTMNAGSALLGDSLDTLGMILHAGRANMGLISAAMVDRYGNINTTCVGDYASPKIRFGGSGGACDFASLASRLVVILEHDKRRFPEKVDFITTPGYLQGKGSRARVGLRSNTGPYAVVTTLGLFQFDEEGEMILRAYHPAASVEEVRKSVQWELKVHDEVQPFEPPSEEELKVLRELDPRGMYLKNIRTLEGIEISV